MSQIFNLDSEMPSSGNMIHRIEHSTTVRTLGGTLLIVGYEVTRFQRFVEKNSSHRLMGPDGVYVYWGTFARARAGKDEFFDSLNLLHLGWGTKTAGLLSMTGTGAISKVAGGLGFEAASTIISGIDNANVMLEYGQGLAAGGPGTGKSPRALLHPSYRRGDVKRNMFRPLMKALGFVDRYYLAFSPRDPGATHAPGVRGEKTRMLLGAYGANTSFLLGDVCGPYFQ